MKEFLKSRLIEILIIALAFVSIFTYCQHKKFEQYKIDTAFKQDSIKGFSEENLLKLIKTMRIDHPEIVLAQAKLETGDFKSYVFKKHNNLFGMSNAFGRPTVRKPVDTNTVYASYRTWQESVIDYALWQAATSNNLTEADYLKRLNRYAEDPNYISKVKIIKTKLIKSNGK